jgi:hypothetical protein
MFSGESLTDVPRENMIEQSGIRNLQAKITHRDRYGIRFNDENKMSDRIITTLNITPHPHWIIKK